MITYMIKSDQPVKVAKIAHILSRHSGRDVTLHVANDLAIFKGLPASLIPPLLAFAEGHGLKIERLDWHDESGRHQRVAGLENLTCYDFLCRVGGDKRIASLSCDSIKHIISETKKQKKASLDNVYFNKKTFHWVGNNVATQQKSFRKFFQLRGETDENITALLNLKPSPVCRCGSVYAQESNLSPIWITDLADPWGQHRYWYVMVWEPQGEVFFYNNGRSITKGQVFYKMLWHALVTDPTYRYNIVIDYFRTRAKRLEAGTEKMKELRDVPYGYIIHEVINDENVPGIVHDVGEDAAERITREKNEQHIPGNPNQLIDKDVPLPLPKKSALKLAKKARCPQCGQPLPGEEFYRMGPEHRGMNMFNETGPRPDAGWSTRPWWKSPGGWGGGAAQRVEQPWWVTDWPDTSVVGEQPGNDENQFSNPSAKPSIEPAFVPPLTQPYVWQPYNTGYPQIVDVSTGYPRLIGAAAKRIQAALDRVGQDPDTEQEGVEKRVCTMRLDGWNIYEIAESLSMQTADVERIIEEECEKEDIETAVVPNPGF